MSFSVGLPRTVCSSVNDFIALEIMESVLTSHYNNFCKFHVLYACTVDTCALETRRRFVTERGKKKWSRNLNPGLTAWVIKLDQPSLEWSFSLSWLRVDLRSATISLTPFFFGFSGTAPDLVLLFSCYMYFYWNAAKFTL